MTLPISRRRFLALSAVGLLGAGGGGLYYAMLKVRDAARRMSED